MIQTPVAIQHYLLTMGNKNYKICKLNLMKSILRKLHKLHKIQGKIQGKMDIQGISLPIRKEKAGQKLNQSLINSQPS